MEEVEMVQNGRDITHRAYIIYSSDLKSWKEAAKSLRSKQWEQSLATEYKKLLGTGTFEWDLPPGRKAVGSKLVLEVEESIQNFRPP